VDGGVAGEVATGVVREESEKREERDLRPPKVGATAVGGVAGRAAAVGGVAGAIGQCRRRERG
jgi:hypothetical protein